MRNKMRGIFEFFKKPPIGFIAFSLILTLFSITGALVVLFIDYRGTWIEAVAYALFALAAVTLSYTVYLSVRYTARVKKWIEQFLFSHKFTNLLVSDFAFRMLVGSVGSFVFCLLFGIFNGIMGIIHLSGWYGALAEYYIILSFIRGGIIIYHRKKHDAQKNKELSHAHVYRNCGILLIILNISLMAAVIQMVVLDMAVIYSGLMIYVTAAYGFCKLSVAIVNIIKSVKQTDLTVRAMTGISLADAAVTILALQTAMLAAFSDQSFDHTMLNALTGIAVCGLTLAMGIYMIIKATKVINTIKSENYNG